jgi:hypothetical protein
LLKSRTPTTSPGDALTFVAFVVAAGDQMTIRGRAEIEKRFRVVGARKGAQADRRDRLQRVAGVRDAPEADAIPGRQRRRRRRLQDVVIRHRRACGTENDPSDRASRGESPRATPSSGARQG